MHDDFCFAYQIKASASSFQKMHSIARFKPSHLIKLLFYHTEQWVMQFFGKNLRQGFKTIHLAKKFAPTLSALRQSLLMVLPTRCYFSVNCVYGLIGCSVMRESGGVRCKVAFGWVTLSLMAMPNVLSSRSTTCSDFLSSGICFSISC